MHKTCLYHRKKHTIVPQYCTQRQVMSWGYYGIFVPYKKTSYYHTPQIIPVLCLGGVRAFPETVTKAAQFCVFGYIRDTIYLGPCLTILSCLRENFDNPHILTETIGVVKLFSMIIIIMITKMHNLTISIIQWCSITYHAC